MNTETIVIFGRTTSSPVRVAWIVGDKAVEAQYQQVATAGKR